MEVTDGAIWMTLEVIRRIDTQTEKHSEAVREVSYAARRLWNGRSTCEGLRRLRMSCVALTRHSASLESVRRSSA
jgi:hypothetical protein